MSAIPPQNASQVDLAAIYRRLLHGWIWIIVLGLIGGLLGLGAAALRQPIYQAAAVLDIGIDYGRTAPLTDIAQKHALQRVRELLYADDTLERALASSTMTPPLDTLRESLRIDSYDSHWELIVFAPDAREAAGFANAWSESAVQALDAAMDHALRAADLQQAIYDLGCTLEAEKDGAGQAVWMCGEGGGGADSSDLADALIEEANLSRGILPAVSYSISARAAIPDKPVSGGRGALAVAGVVLGVLAGVGCAAAGLFDRMLRRD